MVCTLTGDIVRLEVESWYPRYSVEEVWNSHFSGFV